MYKEKLKKISEVEYELPKQGSMKVPGKIFISGKMFDSVEEDSLKQVANVAMLPGIVKSSLGMPDMHVGYGFPIGGVAAFDMDRGVISPGGVGYDINCGVRILATDISASDFMKKRTTVLHDLKRTIPSGVGRGHKEKLSEKEIDEILIKGAEWAVEKGFGKKEDLAACEENGRMKNADPKNVSQRAKARGKPQAGTLGAGNHFIDIQVVEDVFDSEYAKKFGVEKDKIVVMIHCGSRGLGHQVASDYIRLMEENTDISRLPDRELVNAPIKSELGQKYLSAMNCAVNFAFCNRQMIMSYVRGVLERHFPGNKNHLVYDVCHNIAKIEEHVIDDKGTKKQVCVHRKGATRSFDGQPVIIPGSMGTSSYLLVGTKKAEQVSFGSTAHGAGRVMSRTKAKKTLGAEGIKKELQEKDIEVEVSSLKRISEEAPQAYKDVDEVIKVSEKAGIAKPVARLRPVAVIQG